MEAPEKIYIEVTPYGTRYYRDVVKEQRTENSDIEYIRKDTFIEKAADYIANNMRCNEYTLQTKVKFIEDFKKYMEK